jgi:hypothetical protein
MKRSQFRNPVRTCINPNCQHGKAEGLSTGQFQPLYEAQLYCCAECERDHYRKETGRDYRLINERRFTDWRFEHVEERAMKLRELLQQEGKL